MLEGVEINTCMMEINTVQSGVCLTELSRDNLFPEDRGAGFPGTGNQCCCFCFACVVHIMSCYSHGLVGSLAPTKALAYTSEGFLVGA